MKYYSADEGRIMKYLAVKHPPIYQAVNGSYLLTTTEKKRILLNNIYGVDIDSQAVEVTKLSLLLKVLEGESEETINSQMKFFRERALPDLSENIKCGNSLIGPDFYDQMEMNFLDEEEKLRINVFDWETEFKEIMDSGGFDVVIGNPPYVDIKGMNDIEVDYIFKTYKTSNNRINLFASFIEKIFEIIDNSSFRFSFIIPSSILTQESYKQLRIIILEKYRISKIVRLPNESFGSSAGEVKVDTIILVLASKDNDVKETEVTVYEGYERINEININNWDKHYYVSQSEWSKNEDLTFSINRTKFEEEVLRKCEEDSKSLEEYVDFSLGITPYDKYKGHTPQQIKNKAFHSDYKKDETFKKLLAGNDVQRYFVKWNGNFWISYGSWLGAKREQRFFIDKRIIIKQIIDWTDKRIWASIVEEELYNTQNAFTLLSKGELELEILLGIINSKLISFYHKKRFLEEFKMRFQKILIKDCKKFPIKDSQNIKLKAELVEKVKSILKTKKIFQTTKTPQERSALQRQIDATDKQIDQLVYQLYGLTEEEVKIVEGD